MRLTTGQCATLACFLELSAPKPGNVHRGADFEDTTFNDFAASAVALGPIIERALEQPLGARCWRRSKPRGRWRARTRTWGSSCCWFPWPKCLASSRFPAASAGC